MKSGIQELLNQTLELVTFFISNESENSLSKALRYLQNGHQISTQPQKLHHILSSLFENKITNTFSHLRTHSKEAIISYKTYNSRSYELIKEEIWCFQIKETGHQYLSKHQSSGSLQFISTLLKLVSNRLDQTSQTQTQKNKKGAFTHYQILERAQNQIETYSLQSKTSLSLLENNYILNIKILQPKTFPNHLIIETKALDRKLSSETNCTLSKRESVRSKRKSIFSFYDEENQLTILTQKKQNFHCELSEESIVITENQLELDSQTEDCEQILTEEDIKILSFKNYLGEISKIFEDPALESVLD